MGSENVKELILRLADERGQVANRDVAQRTGLTRQAVHRHLSQLVEAGQLDREGAGRGTHYRLPHRGAWRRTWPLDGLEEHDAWAVLREENPALREVEGEVRDVLSYAFTELVNNAIDHSGAETVEVLIERHDGTVGFEVLDEGVGVWDSICAGLGLSERLRALEELTKGKVTTQPDAHSGEGLFFVSKAATRFELDSAGLVWCVDNALGDWAVGAVEPRKGTRVRFELDLDRVRPLQELFAEFTDDFEFDRTRIRIELFEIGTRFVSRSQAKRLVTRLEEFREVVLDFKGVTMVGQGFADEVFRVWARQHPDTHLVPVHMVEPVEFMVERARRSA